MTLEEEAARLNELLVGKVVKGVWRYRPKELGIEFIGGTRLFVDWQQTELEMSITSGIDEEDSN